MAIKELRVSRQIGSVSAAPTTGRIPHALPIASTRRHSIEKVPSPSRSTPWMSCANPGDRWSTGVGKRLNASTSTFYRSLSTDMYLST